MARDYIPRPNVDFHEFQKNLVKQVTANAAVWNIPAGDAGDLAAASAECANRYKAISNKGNRTTTQVMDHDKFRKSYEKDVRKFVNRYLRNNTGISAADLTGMGVKVRGEKRRQRTAITDAPILFVESVPGAYLKFLCRREQHDGKASIHPESDGVELRYSIGTPTMNFNEMPHTFFSKKAHIRMPVELDWRGKKIYICARWVNLANHSRSGPWCTVVIQMVY